MARPGQQPGRAGERFVNGNTCTVAPLVPCGKLGQRPSWFLDRLVGGAVGVSYRTDPPAFPEARDGVLLALLRRRPRSWFELATAGFDGADIRQAVARLTASGAGTFQTGPCGVALDGHPRSQVEGR